MDKTEFAVYGKLIQGKKNISLESIEKDYVISKVLSSYQKLKMQETQLQGLIFKGGTLLAKKYLKYHRISVDLDFTHKDSNEIRLLKGKTREARIKKTIIPLIEAFKKIADLNGFDFQTSRTNIKYVQILNDRSVYKLYIYYNSFINGNEGVIKIEINFIEDLVYDCKEDTLFNLVEFLDIEKKRLSVINFDLVKVIIPQYDVREVMLEKVRAILTRNVLKERDVLDLYLLDKIYPLSKIDIGLIKRKVLSSEGFIQKVDKHLLRSIKLLQEKPQDFLKSDDDIELLLLVKINKEEYNDFKENILSFLVKVIRDIQFNGN